MEKCSVCDLSYTTKPSLEEHKLSLMHHIKLQHQTGQEVHRCDLCGTTFPTLGTYSKHLNEEVHRSALKARKVAHDVKVNEAQLTHSPQPEDKGKGKAGGKDKVVKRDDAKPSLIEKDNPKVQNNMGGKKKSKKKKNNDLNKTADSNKTTDSSKSESAPHKVKKMNQGNECRRSRFDQFSGNWADNVNSLFSGNPHSFNFSQSAGEERFPPPFREDFHSDAFIEEFPPYRNFNDNNYWDSCPKPMYAARGKNKNFFNKNSRGSHHNWHHSNNKKSFQAMEQGNPSNEPGFHGEKFYEGNFRQMKNSKGGGQIVGPNIKRGSTKGRQVSLHASLDRKSRGRSESLDKGATVKQRSSSASGKATHASAASEDPQPEGSNTLSQKAGRIIDNILKGKTPKGLLGAYPPLANKEDDSTPGSPRLVEKPPKAPKQHQQGKDKQEQSKQFQAPKGKVASSKDNPNRGAYLLDRAENLCREIREKRELSKRGKTAQKSSVNEEESRHSSASISRTSLSSSLGSNSRQWSTLDSTESFLMGDTLSTGISLLTTVNRGQTGGSSVCDSISTTAVAMKEPAASSVKRPTVPKLPGRMRQSSESSDKEKNKDKLDKETILKLVNSPRSRKERLQVGKILRTFTKQQKQRPKLALVNALERPEESESEVNLDELPEDIKNQINQLIEEELDSLDPQESAEKGLTVENIQTSLGIEPAGSFTLHTRKGTSRTASSDTVIELLDEDSNDAVEITSVKLSSAAKKKGEEISNSQGREEHSSSVMTELPVSIGIHPRSTDSPLTLNDLAVDSSCRISSSTSDKNPLHGRGEDDHGGIAVSSAASVQESVEAYMSSDHVRSLTASMLDVTYSLSKEQPNNSSCISNSDTLLNATTPNPSRDAQVESETPANTNTSLPAPLFQNYMEVETQNADSGMVLPVRNGQVTEGDRSGSLAMSAVVQPVSVAEDIYSMVCYQSESVPVSSSHSLMNMSFTDSLQKNEFGQFVIEPESSECDDLRQVDDLQPGDNNQVPEIRQVSQLGSQVEDIDVDNTQEEEQSGTITGDNEPLSSGDKNNQAHKRRRSERSPAVQVTASGCDSNSSGNKVDVKRFRPDSTEVEEDLEQGSTPVEKGEKESLRSPHQLKSPPVKSSPGEVPTTLKNVSVPREPQQRLQESYRQVDCVNALYELSVHEEKVRHQLGTVDEELNYLQELLRGTQQKLNVAQQRKQQLLKEENELRTKRLEMLKGAVNNQGYLAKSSSVTSLPYNRHTSTPNVSSISLSTNDNYHLQSDPNNDIRTPSRTISYDEGTNEGTPSHIEPLNIFPTNPYMLTTHDSRDASDDRGGEIVPGSVSVSHSEALADTASCIMERKSTNNSSPQENLGELSGKASESHTIEEADSTVIPLLSPDYETCVADSSSHVLRENRKRHEFVSENDNSVTNLDNSVVNLDNDDDNAGADDVTTGSVFNSSSIVCEEQSESSVTPAGATMQYMGSFSVPGNDSALLHKLAENLAELKHKPFVFLDSTEASMEEQQEKQTMRYVSVEDSPANSSVDTVVANTLDGTNVDLTTNQECEGDGETEILTDSHKSRVKSPKRRKSKKVQAPRSLLQESVSTSEGEDGNTSHTTTVSSSPSRRGRKKKFTNPLDEQLVKEYLHAESSTDVEINGLEAKPHKEKNVPSSSKSSTDIAEILLHDAAITCMCMWNDTLITGSEDGTVRKTYIKDHNFADSKTMVLVQWDKKVQCVHVSNASGRVRIYAAWENSCLTVYDYKTKPRWLTQTKSFGQDLLCLHERWGVLFVGMSKGAVLCFDIKANKQGVLLSVCDRAITQVSSLEDKGRELVVVACADCSVTVRHRHNGTLVYSIEGHTKTPLALHIENDLVYSGGMDRSLQIHKWKTGEVEHVVQLGGVIRNIYVTGEDIYVILQNGVISCYNSKVFCGLKNGRVRKHSIWKREVWPCQFGRCDSLLGSKEDLEQHLLQDHVLPHDKIMCLWKDCPNVYLLSSQPQMVKQHLKSHLS